MANNVKVVLVETDRVIREKIEDIISEENDMRLITTTKSGTIAMESVRKFRPDVLILSSTCQEIESFEVIRILSREIPDLIIIMTDELRDASKLREAMRAGAKDLVVHNEIDEILVKSINDSVDLVRTYGKREELRDGKVIAFMSSKGGVGKSTIAVNTSICIAETFSKRNDDKKILIIDFDLQYGDVSFLTNINPPKTLEYLANKSDIDREMINNLISPNKEYGIYVLPAPSRPEYDSLISAEILIDLINIVKTQYDLIIIDVIQGFQNATMATLEAKPDFLCVVSKADLYNIKNSILTFESLDAMKFGKSKVKLVLNKYNKKSSKKYDIETRVGREIYQVFSDDETSALEASDIGEPIVVSFPKTKLSKEYRVFASKLLKHFYPEEYDVKGSSLTKSLNKIIHPTNS